MYFTSSYWNNLLDNTKRGMMWRFGFHKMIFYKQQEQYVQTTVKEIKYFLVKMLVSNV